MIKTLANQNLPDFKELKHLKRQATTEKCAYNKQNVTVGTDTGMVYVLCGH